MASTSLATKKTTVIIDANTYGIEEADDVQNTLTAGDVALSVLGENTWLYTANEEARRKTGLGDTIIPAFV
jgi:hypothetical protein